LGLAHSNNKLLRVTSGSALEKREYHIRTKYIGAVAAVNRAKVEGVLIPPPEDKSGEDEEEMNAREEAAEKFEAKKQEIIQSAMGSDFDLYETCLEIWGTKLVGQQVFVPGDDSSGDSALKKRRLQQKKEEKKKQKKADQAEDEAAQMRMIDIMRPLFTTSPAEAKQQNDVAEVHKINPVITQVAWLRACFSDIVVLYCLVINTKADPDSDLGCLSLGAESNVASPHELAYQACAAGCTGTASARRDCTIQ